MDLRNWTESLARACAQRPWVTVGLWALAMALPRWLSWIPNISLGEHSPAVPVQQRAEEKQ